MDGQKKEVVSAKERRLEKIIDNKTRSSSRIKK